jgi:hypothetical protein
MRRLSATKHAFIPLQVADYSTNAVHKYELTVHSIYIYILLSQLQNVSIADVIQA